MLFLAGAIVLAAGCASVKPGSEAVRLTRESKEVAGCKEIGSVHSWVNFSFRDAQNQLRNQALDAGGDTVLVTSHFGDDLGTAYNCKEKTPDKPK
jgi:hypothetical protein